MFHPTLTLSVSYTRNSISECSRPLVTKRAAEFDYVAVDLTAFVSSALRLPKGKMNEVKHHGEVARHVLQSTQQLLRGRLHCRRSLLLVVDGAEPLLKACITRKKATGGGSVRRVVNKWMRLPGMPLMQAVESRMVRALPDARLRAPEVAFSGTCVEGSVEEKITRWALDLACRPDHDGNARSMCLIGPTDLYYTAFGLTPYYDVSSAVITNGSDLRQMRLPDMLEWFQLDALAAAEGGAAQTAAARTDTLFLYLLCSGYGPGELPAVQNLRTSFVLDNYHTCVLAASRAVAADPSERKRGEKDGSVGEDERKGPGKVDAHLPEVLHTLFTEAPSGALELDMALLASLLSSATPANRGSSAAQSPPSSTSIKPNKYVDSYLEHVLQVHHSLCFGRTPNPHFVPLYFNVERLTGPSTSTQQLPSSLSVTGPELREHLLSLIASGCTRRSAAPLVYARGTPTTGGATEAEVSGSGDDNAQQGESVDDVVSSASVGVSPFWHGGQSLTAAEFTVLSHSIPSNVDLLLNLYVRGTPKPDTSKLITNAPIDRALALVRDVLACGGGGDGPAATTTSNVVAGANKLANSVQSPRQQQLLLHDSAQHHCLCLAPSYAWVRGRQSKLWRMHYVDLGAQAASRQIRSIRNMAAGESIRVEAGFDAPMLFDGNETREWRPIARFPVAPQVLGDAIATTRDAKNDSTTGSSSSRSQIHEIHSVLKVLSWNVMFDRYSGQPTPLGMPGIDWCSPQRYPVLARIIEREDADVVGMQEVEPMFAEYLTKQSWCQERYVLSCATGSSVLAPWGVWMLVHRRLLPRVRRMIHMNVPAWNGHVSLMPVVSIENSGGAGESNNLLHIAAVHLLAPFTKNHESARTEQDAALRHNLIKGISGDCLVMGDFNDWPQNEFVMPADSQYVECWPLLHPDKPGYTIDESNTFCKLKIEEMFFGRSDKVLLRSSRRVAPVEAHLVGTKSVNDENGDANAPAYLFPSDHFGVSFTFAMK